MRYVCHDGKIRCIKLQWVEQITTDTKGETTHEGAIAVWIEAKFSRKSRKSSSKKETSIKWGETSSNATLILLPQSTLPEYHIVRRWFDTTLAHRGTSCIGVCSVDINNRSWHHTTSSLWLSRYPFDTKISPFHILLVNCPSPKHLLDSTTMFHWTSRLATFNIAENSGLVVSSSNTG